jgi:hypothetical protein
MDSIGLFRLSPSAHCPPPSLSSLQMIQNLIDVRLSPTPNATAAAAPNATTSSTLTEAPSLAASGLSPPNGSPAPASSSVRPLTLVPNIGIGPRPGQQFLGAGANPYPRHALIPSHRDQGALLGKHPRPPMHTPPPRSVPPSLPFLPPRGPIPLAGLPRGPGRGPPRGVPALKTPKRSTIPLRYELANDPFPHWKKEVFIPGWVSQTEWNGKPQIQFTPPSSSVSLQTKEAVSAYLLAHEELHSLQSSIDCFDFREVFCLCHKPEISEVITYMECMANVAGCNSWFHPECAGWDRFELDLYEDEIICPLCTEYMESNPSVNLLVEQRYGFSDSLSLLTSLCLALAPLLQDSSSLISERNRSLRHSWRGLSISCA